MQSEASSAQLRPTYSLLSRTKIGRLASGLPDPSRLHPCYCVPTLTASHLAHVLLLSLAHSRAHPAYKCTAPCLAATRVVRLPSLYSSQSMSPCGSHTTLQASGRKPLVPWSLCSCLSVACLSLWTYRTLCFLCTAYVSPSGSPAPTRSSFSVTFGRPRRRLTSHSTLPCSRLRLLCIA
jgi:hypothetical protein